MTFQTMLEGHTNAIARASAKAAAAHRRGSDTAFNLLLIYGLNGLGKTHLLQATVAANGLLYKGFAVYLSVVDCWVHGIEACIGQRCGLSFDAALETLDLIAIDDVHLMPRRLASAFGNVLDRLIRSGVQVVAASAVAPAELDNFDGRVQSRLIGGLAVPVGLLTPEMVATLLNSRLAAQAPALILADDVRDYAVTAIAGNGRMVDCVANAIIASGRMLGRPITVPEVETVLSDLIRPPEPKRVRIEDIQRYVARHFNVSRDDMMSARRTANVVRPRQIAMYFAKTLTLRSLPEIGRRFGGRDHTTVLHAVRRIEGMVAADAQFAGEIEAIKRVLGA